MWWLLGRGFVLGGEGSRVIEKLALSLVGISPVLEAGVPKLLHSSLSQCTLDHEAVDLAWTHLCVEPSCPQGVASASVLSARGPCSQAAGSGLSVSFYLPSALGSVALLLCARADAGTCLNVFTEVTMCPEGVEGLSRARKLGGVGWAVFHSQATGRRVVEKARELQPPQ